VNDRFPCRCGHALQDHNSSITLMNDIVQSYCWGCFQILRQYRDESWIRYCVHDFVGDNLAYLERRSETL